MKRGKVRKLHRKEGEHNADACERWLGSSSWGALTGWKYWFQLFPLLAVLYKITHLSSVASGTRSSNLSTLLYVTRSGRGGNRTNIFIWVYLFLRKKGQMPCTVALVEKRAQSRGMPSIWTCAAPLQGLDDPFKLKKHILYLGLL